MKKKKIEPEAGIGKVIKQLRKNAEMNQTDFANVLHLSQSAISKIESGLLWPDVFTLFILRKEFKFNINKYFDQLIEAKQAPRSIRQ